VRKSVTNEAVVRREQLLISVCVALVTTLAWAYLFRLDHLMSAGLRDESMMAAMGMSVERAWTGLDALFTFAMWSVMMVGMMAPTALPMLLVFAPAQATRGQKSLSLPTLAFGLGYVGVWTGFSAGATLAQYELHRAALLSPAMASSSTRLTGAILLAAGAYQLTHWKAKCLMHCRSPLGFFMTNWRDGVWGAFQMGFRHGAYCLGCCWALMCLLFVVGIMNLLWIGILTGFVLIEKIGPAGAITSRIAGAAMVILGIAVIL
jgi:predicted metal-binding membrane protein